MPKIEDVTILKMYDENQMDQNVFWRWHTKQKKQGFDTQGTYYPKFKYTLHSRMYIVF